MITFKIRPHTTRPGVDMVEIYSGDAFLGAIYPDEKSPDRIRILSKHFAKADVGTTETGGKEDPNLMVFGVRFRLPPPGWTPTAAFPA